jgi:hypothetical protein
MVFFFFFFFCLFKDCVFPLRTAVHFFAHAHLLCVQPTREMIPACAALTPRRWQLSKRFPCHRVTTCSISAPRRAPNFSCSQSTLRSEPRAGCMCVYDF